MNLQGLAPIYCRLTLEGKRKEFSTEYNVKPDRWNSDLKKAKGHEHINEGLLQLEARVRAVYQQAKQSGKPVCLETLVSDLNPTSVTLMPLTDFMAVYKKGHEGKKANTARTLRSRHSRLLKWLGEAGHLKMMLNEVSLRTGRQLEETLIASGAKPAYIRKIYQYFRQVMEAAQVAGHIEKNPLAGYLPKHGPQQPKNYLSTAEVTRLYNYKFASPTLQKAVDLFVFQCWTSLAHVDTQTFDAEKHLQTTADGKRWIKKARQKTGQQQSIPLMPVAEAILAKYSNRLPVFSNQRQNAYIKEAAAIVGIEKHVTCHVARKTAATYFYNIVAPRTTAAILGHASTNMTERLYAEVTPETMMLDVAVLFNKGAA